MGRALWSPDSSQFDQKRCQIVGTEQRLLAELDWSQLTELDELVKRSPPDREDGQGLVDGIRRLHEAKGVGMDRRGWVRRGLSASLFSLGVFVRLHDGPPQSRCDGSPIFTVFADLGGALGNFFGLECAT
jgi:hypothetical protein